MEISSVKCKFKIGDKWRWAMNFLVVDDNSSVRYVVSSIIKLFGHGTDEANDGLEAIQKLRKNQYDVVITDAEMPNMDGAELCKIVKSETPGIFIIGISGCPSFLDGLKEAGADICLSKPFSMHALEEAIGDRFRSSRLT
jgi:CheY-like chemotaxis protein